VEYNGIVLPQRVLQNLANQLSMSPSLIAKEYLSTEPVLTDKRGMFGLYLEVVEQPRIIKPGRVAPKKETYENQLPSVRNEVMETLRAYAYSSNKEKVMRAMLQASKDNRILFGSSLIYLGNILRKLPEAYQFVKDEVVGLDKRVSSILPEATVIHNHRDRKKMKSRGSDVLKFGRDFVRSAAAEIFNQTVTNGGKAVPKHFENTPFEIEAFQDKVLEGVSFSTEKYASRLYNIENGF
jgi:hypothetical protein